MLLFIAKGTLLAQNCSINAGLSTTICQSDSMKLFGTSSGLFSPNSTSKWTKISGPDATIVNPDSLVTTVIGYTPGTYYFNLKNNPNLVASIGIEEGQLKPHEIAFMTHQDMMPERWTVLLAKKAKEDANRYEVNVQAATDSFTCRKCKSRKCTYTQIQIKSSDEPMTTFVSCLDCGARWKC